VNNVHFKMCRNRQGLWKVMAMEGMTIFQGLLSSSCTNTDPQKRVIISCGMVTRILLTLSCIILITTLKDAESVFFVCSVSVLQSC